MLLFHCRRRREYKDEAREKTSTFLQIDSFRIEANLRPSERRSDDVCAIQEEGWTSEQANDWMNEWMNEVSLN